MVTHLGHNLPAPNVGLSALLAFHRISCSLPSTSSVVCGQPQQHRQGQQNTMSNTSQPLLKIVQGRHKMSETTPITKGAVSGTAARDRNERLQAVAAPSQIVRACTTDGAGPVGSCNCLSCVRSRAVRRAVAALEVWLHSMLPGQSHGG